MIIEFYGLPGSGKTYTAKKLRKNFQLIEFNSKLEKYLFSILFMISHPLFSFYLFLKLNSNSNPHETIKLRVIRNILLLATLALYQKARGKAIIEEGFFQLINTIFEVKREEKEILNLLKKIPKPDVLVVFDVKDEIRLKRLRRKPRIDFGEAYFNSWIKVMEHNDFIIRKFLAYSNFKIYYLKNTNNKEINKLKAYLENE